MMGRSHQMQGIASEIACPAVAFDGDRLVRADAHAAARGAISMSRTPNHQAVGLPRGAFRQSQRGAQAHRIA